MSVSGASFSSFLLLTFTSTIITARRMARAVAALDSGKGSPYMVIEKPGLALDKAKLKSG